MANSFVYKFFDDEAMALWRPNVNSLVPCVLWNHGSKGDNSLFSPTPTHLPNVVKAYLSMGMAVCVFSRRGYNGREGLSLSDELRNCPDKKTIDATIVNRLETETIEVMDCAKTICDFKWLDKTRLFCAGYSMGGILTLLALSKLEIFSAGIAFSPGAMMWQDFKQVRRLIIEAALKLTKPIIVIQTNNDYNIAPSTILKRIFKKKSIPHEVIVFPKHGTTYAEAHNFYDTGYSLWKETVELFCKENVHG